MTAPTHLIGDDDRKKWVTEGKKQGLFTEKEEKALVLWADGHGYGRVASILMIPRETARSRIQRALVRVELSNK